MAFVLQKVGSPGEAAAPPVPPPESKGGGFGGGGGRGGPSGGRGGFGGRGGGGGRGFGGDDKVRGSIRGAALWCEENSFQLEGLAKKREWQDTSHACGQVCS
jgi:hypothetical protein